MKYHSKRKALEVALESDYDKEVGYDKQNDHRDYENDVVIDGVSNDNDKESDLNCNNILYARDNGKNIHDEQNIIPSS